MTIELMTVGSVSSLRYITARSPIGWTDCYELMAVSPDWSKLGPEFGPLRVVGFGVNCHHFGWIIDVHLS